MLTRTALGALLALLGVVGPGDTGLAKGLDELAENNPENAATEEAAAETEGAAEGGAASAEAAATARPEALADRLFLATSFGWVKASRGEGEWKSSGMSDLTVGYKLPLDLGERLGLYGTYRYAPMAVSGVVDDHSYRGVFEAHNFGALGFYKVKDGLKATASFEAGYVLVYLDSLDGLELNKKHESDGGIAVLGGGADWTIFEKCELGPRLYAGFGQFTVVQVGAQASFTF